MRRQKGRVRFSPTPSEQTARRTELMTKREDNRYEEKAKNLSTGRRAEAGRSPEATKGGGKDATGSCGTDCEEQARKELISPLTCG